MPDLDPREREELAADVVDSLEHALLGSLPTLRGSLALGGADAYSDIDILWQVQEGSLMLALKALPRALEAVRPIESFRVDPSSTTSPTRRLVFARLAEVPLFWRLDIEIVEPTALEDRPQLPQHGDEVDDPDWSPTESALMNAVAAAKVPTVGEGPRRRATSRSGTCHRSNLTFIRSEIACVLPNAKDMVATGARFGGPGTARR